MAGGKEEPLPENALKSASDPHPDLKLWIGGNLNHSVKVMVEWSVEKQAHLPTGGEYSTVARFPDERDWPSGDTWSIVLELPSAEKMRAGAFEARAHFLISDAPTERLKPGCTFELFEGWVKTATVYVS
jgi:hypothetical protein